MILGRDVVEDRRGLSHRQVQGLLGRRRRRGVDGLLHGQVGLGGRRRRVVGRRRRGRRRVVGGGGQVVRARDRGRVRRRGRGRGPAVRRRRGLRVPVGRRCGAIRLGRGAVVLRGRDVLLRSRAVRLGSRAVRQQVRRRMAAVIRSNPVGPPPSYGRLPRSVPLGQLVSDGDGTVRLRVMLLRVLRAGAGHGGGDDRGHGQEEEKVL